MHRACTQLELILICIICILGIALTCHAQLDAMQYTQGADGVYYPNNIVLEVGSDGVWYTRVQSAPPSAWQLPEYASTVLRLEMLQATNESGFVVDTSAVGTNNYWLSITNSATLQWNAPSNGICANYYNENTYIYDYDKTYYDMITSFSVFIWVKISPAVEDRIFIGHANGNPYGGWCFGYGNSALAALQENGKLSLFVGNYNAGQGYRGDKGGQLVNDGTWKHVGVTFDYGTKTATFYVNGQQGSSQTYSNSTFNLSSTNRMFIGVKPQADFSWNTFAGNWQGHTIWTNTIISSAQVLDIYTNTHQYHGWSNSLARSNPSLYAWCNGEYCLDYNYPADLKSTNHFAYPDDASRLAFRADGTNGFMQADGSSDYLRYALALIPSSSTNYAMSCTFKPIATNVARQIIMTVNSDNTNSAINIELQLDKLVYSTHAGGFTNVLGTTIVNTTAWHRVVVSCANTTGSLYLDGALEASGAIGLATNLSRTECTAINGSLYYNGYIDNIRFFTNALSSGDITDL